MITSYDLLRRDVELYDALYFHYHIIDEAQYIKNFATKNAKAVNALCSGHRFALTGTPVENRLSEHCSFFNARVSGQLSAISSAVRAADFRRARRGSKRVASQSGAPLYSTAAEAEGAEGAA